MLDISEIGLPKMQKHQLNNQGCRCEMCQKLNHEQTMKIVIEHVVDHQSEFYASNAKEYYLKIVNKMADWDKKPRKFRFALPQICVYENSQPSLLIIKKNQDHNIKINRDKSKMHMFQVIQFFLEGFVYHNPQPAKRNHRKRATSFTVGNHAEKHKNDCIIIAKYRNNFYNMLTLVQMEGLFKSRQKYMRDGLMYLQTLVCTKDYTETRINLNLREMMKSQTHEKIYQRARFQVRMFHEEIKSSDIDFITELEEIQFENQLKSKSMRDYFQYLTMKIVLAISKTDTQIISQAVFKYVHSKTKCYLIDVRVSKIESNQQFWATAAMKAFEYKLSRRMSMIDVGSVTKEDQLKKRNLGKKAHNISLWLEKNTEQQWDQMSVIRTRLERLEKQKKSLMQSQSAVEGSTDMAASKSFKIRNVRGK